jgi:hypothetical protein
MSIYMLNLVFNPNDTTESTDSRFLEYDSTQTSLLLQSKVWLTATNTSPNPDVATDWQYLESDTSLLTLNAGDQVFFRVCGGSGVTTGFQARLTTIIARNTGRASKRGNGKPFQTRASPFALANTQQSCVIFDTFNPPFQPPSAAGSWVQGPVTVAFTTPPPNPKPPNFHDSYSCVLAVTVGGPSATLTYSHDPDMDVNC